MRRGMRATPKPRTPHLRKIATRASSEPIANMLAYGAETTISRGTAVLGFACRSAPKRARRFSFSGIFPRLTNPAAGGDYDHEETATRYYCRVYRADAHELSGALCVADERLRCDPCQPSLHSGNHAPLLGHGRWPVYFCGAIRLDLYARCREKGMARSGNPLRDPDRVAYGDSNCADRICRVHRAVTTGN